MCLLDIGIVSRDYRVVNPFPSARGDVAKGGLSQCGIAQAPQSAERAGCQLFRRCDSPSG